MKSEYSTDIKLGDLIAVARPWGHDIGFYAGQGRNTIQYYCLSTIGWWWDNVRGNKGTKRLYKSYIYECRYKVMKITPETLNREVFDLFDKGVQVMKEMGIITEKEEVK